MIPVPPGLDDDKNRPTLPPGTPVTNTFGAYPYVRPDRPFAAKDESTGKRLSAPPGETNYYPRKNSIAAAQFGRNSMKALPPRWIRDGLEKPAGVKNG